MEPNQQITTEEDPAARKVPQIEQLEEHPLNPRRGDPWETRAAVWVFWGPQGIRAGWSISIFLILTAVLMAASGAIFVSLHLVDPKLRQFTPSSAFFNELVMLLPVVGAAAVVALIERRRGNLLAYNLLGRHRLFYFFSGCMAGFLALSAMVGGLHAGHWLAFGPPELTGGTILRFAAIWGIAFLAVGCFEEGVFRCYLQSTLTRGLNFWWALGLVILICAGLLIRTRTNGAYGVYLVAVLGVLPCLWCEWNKTPQKSFWQAAWVTSTLFGFVHTGNNGENWIGIFAAAGIGFVFCVSVYVTGSAWWAIGCHAAWDWAETFFYGTADSGNVAAGHWLSTAPAGNPLWSGGTDGPEGSLLALPVILLLLGALLAVYGRRPRLPVADQVAAD